MRFCFKPRAPCTQRPGEFSKELSIAVEDAIPELYGVVEMKVSLNGLWLNSSFFSYHFCDKDIEGSVTMSAKPVLHCVVLGVVLM